MQFLFFFLILTLLEKLYDKGPTNSELAKSQAILPDSCEMAMMQYFSWSLSSIGSSFHVMLPLAPQSPILAIQFQLAWWVGHTWYNEQWIALLHGACRHNLVNLDCILSSNLLLTFLALIKNVLLLLVAFLAPVLGSWFNWLYFSQTWQSGRGEWLIFQILLIRLAKWGRAEAVQVQNFQQA